MACASAAATARRGPASITVWSRATVLAPCERFNPPRRAPPSGNAGPLAPPSDAVLTVPTGGGTYSVTGLVRWEPAPGTLPPGFIDLIGFAADTSPGLAVLRIAYSDGSAGVLVLSCTFAGTPPAVFEGVTASKGFVDYWNRQEEDFTDFHLRHVR